MLKHKYHCDYASLFLILSDIHHHHNYLRKQIILDSCSTNLRDILTTVDEYPRATRATVSFVLDKHN